MSTNPNAAGRERCMPAPAPLQPEPAHTASGVTPATPRGGILALLRQAAGPAHDPKTCLPRGSFQGEWDLCEGCREAVAVRVAALAEQLKRTESNLWLLCTLRGLQALASAAPLPLPVRTTLWPFGAPQAVAEARYLEAMGPGLAADLAQEEEQEQIQATLWAELLRNRKGAPKEGKEASHGG